MTLTDDEIEEAARRLWNGSGAGIGSWTEQSNNCKHGIRQIVTGLANELSEPSATERNAALFVFMTWMGEP